MSKECAQVLQMDLGSFEKLLLLAIGTFDNEESITIEELVKRTSLPDKTIKKIILECRVFDGFLAVQKLFSKVKVKAKAKANTEIDVKVEEVLNYLNTTANRKFRGSSTSKKFIVERLKEEGVTVPLMKAVIDLKVKAWSHTDMDIYLRPETLFNKTKFDSYFEEASRQMEETIEKQNAPLSYSEKAMLEYAEYS
ncbi:MAG: conserved phage C-terminal domain-containing protein [Fusobacteriaceae bacterium]